jgi:hypothetical protein
MARVTQVGNLMYRFRVRWGERVAYWLSQITTFGMGVIMLVYLSEHSPSDSMFPPLTYLAGIVVWAYTSEKLRHYREHLLAYKRLQQRQWEMDAGG